MVNSCYYSNHLFSMYHHAGIICVQNGKSNSDTWYISFIKIMNRRGPSTESGGTPKRIDCILS